MDSLLFTPDMSVAETLQRGGQIPKVFIEHKTACVGCYLAHFCTLKDVARTYDLQLDPFLSKLQQAAQECHPTLSGAKR